MVVTIIIDRSNIKELSTPKVTSLLNLLKNKKVNYSSEGAEFALIGDIKTIYSLEPYVKELYLLIALWEKVRTHHIADNGNLHITLNTNWSWNIADATLLNKITKELK